MISYKNSRIELKNSKLKISNEIINSANCLNRVLASNNFSKTNNPAADNAAFDGYAINSKDTKNLNKKNQNYSKLQAQLLLAINLLIKKQKNLTLLKL